MNLLIFLLIFALISPLYFVYKQARPYLRRKWAFEKLSPLFLEILEISKAVNYDASEADNARLNVVLSKILSFKQCVRNYTESEDELIRNFACHAHEMIQTKEEFTLGMSETKPEKKPGGQKLQEMLAKMQVQAVSYRVSNRELFSAIKEGETKWFELVYTFLKRVKNLMRA